MARVGKRCRLRRQEVGACNGERGEGQAHIRDTRHGKFIKLPGGKSLTITTHNPGSKQLKPVYVKKFLDFMIDLGWYEE